MCDNELRIKKVKAGSEERVKEEGILFHVSVIKI